MEWWNVFWEWFWTKENGSWLILGIFGVFFLFTELPKLIYTWKTTPAHDPEDRDPSGNDNIRRKPYDYM